MSDMRPAEASNILEAVRVLERLESSGDITPAEQTALNKYRAKQRSAEEVQAETASRYRGFQKEASFRLADEIAGARAAVADFVQKGDTKSASAAYAKYRDLVRQKDEAAQLLYPEEFKSGSVGGGLSTMGMIGGAGAKLISKLPMLAQMGIGAAGGGTAVAAPQFFGGEGGFKNRLSEISPAMTAVGAGVGAAAPAIGAVAGGLTRKAQLAGKPVPGVANFSPSASRRVAGRLGTAERAGTGVQPYLGGVGPEGMIVDVPGAPRALGQSLATIQGEGADIMRNAIEGRAAGAGGRIEQSMTQNIAAPEAAFLRRVAEANRRSSTLGPLYDAALDANKKFDIDYLRKAIKASSKEQSSSVRSALSTVLSDLGKKGKPISAVKLHNARVALSDAMNEAVRAGAGGKVKALGGVLDEIDAQLDTIPNYAAARGGWADSKSIDDAIDAGRGVFSGGPVSAQSPEQLQATFAKLTDPQKEAFRQGAREYIAALMGTSRNDAAAAWAAFDKGWNDKKLRLILGDDAADNIINRLRAEKTFSETRGEVLKGSQTSFREEGRAAVGDIRDPDTLNMPGPVERLRRGINSQANKIIDEILVGGRRSNLNRQIGELLSLQGAERDAAVSALLQEARMMDDPTLLSEIVRAITSGAAFSTTGLLAQ